MQVAGLVGSEINILSLTHRHFCVLPNPILTFFLYIVLYSSFLCTDISPVFCFLRISLVRIFLGRGSGVLFLHAHADIRCCSSALRHYYAHPLLVTSRCGKYHSSINTIVYCLMYMNSSTAQFDKSSYLTLAWRAPPSPKSCRVEI